MAYVDLEVAYPDGESPHTAYRLLAERLPVTFTVLETHPEGARTRFPVVRFFGHEESLRQLVRRWLTYATPTTPPRIHAMNEAEHHEVIQTMASEMAEAFNRRDDGAADHLYDQLCRYVAEHLGPAVVPVMIVKVDRQPRRPR